MVAFMVGKKEKKKSMVLASEVYWVIIKRTLCVCVFQQPDPWQTHQWKEKEGSLWWGLSEDLFSPALENRHGGADTLLHTYLCSSTVMQATWTQTVQMWENQDCFSWYSHDIWSHKYLFYKQICFCFSAIFILGCTYPTSVKNGLMTLKETVAK